MSRADRLELVARTLRDWQGITAAQLAEELGVSVRSVFRDLEHLRARGYPIDADRGRGGGLRLHRSWGLGRVLLSTEEALCTLLSLAVSDCLDFPLFGNELPRARRKIVDAFPSAERQRIGPLRERIFVGQAASSRVRESYRPPRANVMRSLQVAFAQQKIIHAEYVKENGERTTRRIEPHALLISWPAWYLLGHDHARAEPRTYRLDRFVEVRIEPVGFTARPREVARSLLEGPSRLPLKEL